MDGEKKDRYMQMAVDLSEQSIDQKKGGPFGAIIVRENRIIGSSGNYVFQNFDPSAHAEIMAIRDACKNLQTLDLSGSLIFSSSEPCPMCLAAIYWANLKEIYYSNSEETSMEYGFIDKEILSELKLQPDKRKIKSHHIKNARSIKIFEKALTIHF